MIPDVDEREVRGTGLEERGGEVRVVGSEARVVGREGEARRAARELGAGCFFFNFAVFAIVRLNIEKQRRGL